MEYGKWKSRAASGADHGGGGSLMGPSVPSAGSSQNGEISRRVRLTVNICCGLLALLSAVMLVVVHSGLFMHIANFVANKVWDIPDDYLKVRRIYRL